MLAVVVVAVVLLEVAAAALPPALPPRLMVAARFVSCVCLTTLLWCWLTNRRNCARLLAREATMLLRKS